MGAQPYPPPMRGTPVYRAVLRSLLYARSLRLPRFLSGQLVNGKICPRQRMPVAPQQAVPPKCTAARRDGRCIRDTERIHTAHPQQHTKQQRNDTQRPQEAAGQYIQDAQHCDRLVQRWHYKGADRCHCGHDDHRCAHNACADGSILQNKEIVSAFSYAKENGKNIHFMGLTSNGGVHSSFDHLFKLCDISKEYGIENTFIHCFMDGRDTDPKSGKGFIEQLTAHCEKSAGKIASIVGRFYAMDRDKRWERVKVAYDLLVNGEGKVASDMVQAMQESYDEGVTDEFIKPIVNANFDGTIKEGDVVIFFNYRNDRAKELTIVLTQQDMPEQGMHTIPGLQYYCMTPYDASFKGVHILFDKENVQNTLGEYLAANGKTQLHIAETEKYAHVTFFFNGGRETPYDAEERILVPSPKVATYDLKPEMSAYEVKDKLVEAINTKKFDFIVVNYANGDMVGHTGIYEAIEKAVKAIDECVKDTVEAAKANDYEVIIIADHGNADHALNEDGTPNTAHSLNPVPFVYVTENKDAKVENGVLADVAPSILHILGMKQPAEMTGKDLIIS